MSSEYFTRTSLYLVRLKIFEWIKLLRRHLHQIQGNGAGRNFITASRVNSRLITHAKMQRSIWNLQLATVQLLNNKFINGCWEGGGYAWPGLTVNRVVVQHAIAPVCSLLRDIYLNRIILCFITKLQINNKNNIIIIQGPRRGRGWGGQCPPPPPLFEK